MSFHIVLLTIGKIEPGRSTKFLLIYFLKQTTGIHVHIFIWEYTIDIENKKKLNIKKDIIMLERTEKENDILIRHDHKNNIKSLQDIVGTDAS